MFEAIEDIDAFLTQLILGDDEAWSTLMREGQRDLIKVYIRLGFAKWEAKELWDKSVHKLFYSKFAKYDPDKGSLDRWVKTVARRVGQDEKRRRERKLAIPLDDIIWREPSKSEQTDISSETCAHVQCYCTCVEEKESGQSDLCSPVRTALNLLSEKNRNVLLKRFVDDLPFDVIAESLGISETAARMRASRARKIIKAEIERLCPRELRRRIRRLRRRRVVGVSPAN